jgi:hydrogenase maturation protease
MVIGIGNAYRGDDAAGLVVARALRARGVEAVEPEGEPVALLDAFAGHDEVVLVDAVRSGVTPGTVHRVDVSTAPLPAELEGAPSTHTLGLGEAIELARALDRLPRRVVVFGIEGERFAAGTELSPAVAAAVEPLIEEILRKGPVRPAVNPHR